MPDDLEPIIDFLSAISSFLATNQRLFSEHILSVQTAARVAVGRSARYDDKTGLWMGIDSNGRDKVLREATDEEIALQDEIQSAAIWIHGLEIERAENEANRIRNLDPLDAIQKSVQSSTSEIASIRS